MKTTSRRPALSVAMRFIALLFGALFVAQTATASDYVVMESEGDVTYQIGDIVENAVPISLPEDASLTLVSSGGEKIRVEGPFIGTLDVNDDSVDTGSDELVRSLAQLFRTQAEWAATRKLVRSFGGEPNADPWIFDIEWTSAYCYRNPGEIALWRKQAPQGGTLEIAVSGDSIKVKWPKGDNRLDWPTDMPVFDGEEFDLRYGDTERRAIEFRKLPADLPTRAHMASWMADNACDDQAVLLMLNAEIDWMLSGLVKSGEF